MGYFPNGTMGGGYYDRYCERCVHDRTDAGCPIWNAHLLFNTGNHESPERHILDMLIPMSADGLWNEQCRFFSEVKQA